MSDLIDRETVRLQLVEMRKFDDEVGRTDWKYRDGICRVERLIREAPAVDAKPVRHGKWLLHKPRRTGRNATYKCSCCGKLRSSYYNDVQDWAYCPCGAKMEG